ncbi:MAG: tRNA lysidine(34) synthetase TilS [Pseudomonadales bacterium]|nr:tRNA lysidine(34) synthetase TilS [Pseudomonadales bacterium]
MPKANDLNIELIQQALAALPGPCHIHVGYSGGLDSTVLLHLVYEWWQQQSGGWPPLQAIHINHQLQADAERWQTHCVRLCQQWGIPCYSESIVVDTAESSLEQQARLARYRVFREQVKPGEVLLLAHHRDDQVETLLQRLARGSGPLGLGAMAQSHDQQGFAIVRPLLECDRAELEIYARQRGLSWIDDPSNQDETIERNFVRRQLLPLWRSLHPRLNQTLARSARLARESAELLDELAQLDRGDTRPDGGLSLERLLPLNPARRHNLLRFWLRSLGIQPPSEVILGRIVAEVALAAADAQPQVSWGDCSVRRFQGVLHGMDRPLPEAGGTLIPFANLEQSIPLPWGRLRTSGGKVPISRQALVGKELKIGFRNGGERLSLPGRPAKALKDLFLEAGVPPWLRGLWPILYADGEIACLPGLWVCEGYAPRAADDQIQFFWERTESAQD